MNLPVLFQSQLRAAGPIGGWVLKNLETLVTAITLWGEAEHNEDGTHKHVTASTLAVNGLGLADRLGVSNVLVWDYLADASGVIMGPGVREAGLIIHVDRTPGAGGVTRTVHSLDSTGRRSGEVVWFLHVDSNAAPAGTTFRLHSGTPGDGTRFRGQNTAASSIVMRGNSLIPLMFLSSRDVGIDSSSSFWYVGQV
jgi:hypothetical protein